MTAHNLSLPRERLDARIGWQGLRPMGQPQSTGLVEQNALLQLASAKLTVAGLVFEQPIADSDVWGSFGGRTLPHGLTISDQGEAYLADPERSRVLYTRASLPPETSPSDPFAPFVPLFEAPLDADHPLRLSQPVDLALVPVEAALGSMTDALVVADAGRVGRLLWLNRRTGALLWQTALPGQPIALGVSATGLVRVAIHTKAGADLLTLRFGRITRRDALTRVPHALHVFADGRAVMADQTGLWALGLQGQPVETAGEYPPPLTLGTRGLTWANGCPDRDPVCFTDISLDRHGALNSTGLNATGLPIITLPRRLPRPRRGQWIAGPFDGGARGFAWHRIALDSVVPDQCRIVLSTYVSDFAEDITELTPWTGESVINPRDHAEALVQNNRGRYLWLRIEAFGDGNTTPEISGIDIFGPRRSQLDYLPAPFREDPETAHFLDRFLSLQDEFLAEALARFDSMGGDSAPSCCTARFFGVAGKLV